jgi:hypothetical protein
MQIAKQSSQLGGLNDTSGGRSSAVLLLMLAGLRVLVVEDEVDLVGMTGLVGAN